MGLKYLGSNNFRHWTIFYPVRFWKKNANLHRHHASSFACFRARGKYDSVTKILLYWYRDDMSVVVVVKNG
jgi:hypothetical protein